MMPKFLRNCALVLILHFIAFGNLGILMAAMGHPHPSASPTGPSFTTFQTESELERCHRNLRTEQTIEKNCNNNTEKDIRNVQSCKEKQQICNQWIKDCHTQHGSTPIPPFITVPQSGVNSVKRSNDLELEDCYHDLKVLLLNNRFCDHDRLRWREDYKECHSDLEQCLDEYEQHCFGGCRDDDALLRETLQAFVNNSGIITGLACIKFKDSEIWRLPEIQPTLGPGDTWLEYCRSIFSEVFGSNIDNFPCGELCGFCNACGRKPERIVGGAEATPYSIPWQVALVNRASNTPFCGGTLISERHVLTAAHCTSPFQDYDVIVGEHRTTSSEDGTRHSICRYVDHPSYNSPPPDFDFSILHLDQPIQLGVRAVPACMPSADFSGNYLDGKNLTVSGWGALSEGGVSPTVLHSVAVPGMTNFHCNEPSFLNGRITDAMLCAGQPSGGIDSCQGDSGGPLTYTSRGQTYIVGVVSWGIGCGQVNKPGVYARVTEVSEWINGELTQSCNATAFTTPRPTSRPTPTPSAGNTCNLAMNLSSISSPFSGTTTGARNDYSTQCGGGAGPERIFYLDMKPGDTLTIAQISNQFDSVHQLAYGGSCPGTNSIDCTDDPDTQSSSWTNYFDAVERVYFMIDAYSTGYGDFTIVWNISQACNEDGDCNDPTRPYCSNGYCVECNQDVDCTDPSLPFCRNETCSVNSCDIAVDLKSISSPFFGTTTGARNDYSTQCGGSGPESIFYLDMQPGEMLTIGQTWNEFDSRHQLAYGGSCPGTSQVDCTDDPDTQSSTWTNSFDVVVRVYFMIDAFSNGYGNFTIAWSIFHGNPTTLSETFPPATLFPPIPTENMTTDTTTANTKTTSTAVTRCFDSTSCGEDGFCNFDFNSDGFCELCGNFPNPETDCKEAGFITQMGENECKRACKGCRDDDALLRETLQGFTNNSGITDELTCITFKESEIWRLPELQPTQGPGDTWLKYCASIFSEMFQNSIAHFPCGESCGFCNVTSATTRTPEMTTTTDIDQCSSNPCQYGGNCTNQIDGYTCDCVDGYDGTNCENDIDECVSTPCQNGGSCTNQINGYTCNCVDGYNGTNCESDIDECATIPCQNGGSCIDQINGYSCNCDDGYNGTNCENDIDECASTPCQNGGSCTDQISSYTCNCADGYVGTHCETDVNECASTPCQNGGLCTDQINGYTCNCVNGYGGNNCQNEPCKDKWSSKKCKKEKKNCKKSKQVKRNCAKTCKRC